MIKATLADLRQSSSFFKTDEIIEIINGRKKEQIGYFVPISLQEVFEDFLIKIKKEQKRKLLKRVANASRKDIVGDGAVDDGIK
jgi:hypothetical protein